MYTKNIRKYIKHRNNLHNSFIHSFIHSFTGAYSPGRTLGLPFRGFLITQRHTVGLLWTSDQPVAEATQNNTTYILNMRQTSMPWVGFEPATPATKRLQTYTLDHAATGIGIYITYNLQNSLPFYLQVFIKWIDVHLILIIPTSLWN
jgi:hypothetical protein